MLACALPFVSYPGSSPDTESLFDYGAGVPHAEYWFTVEPVAAVLLGIVAGVLLLLLQRRRLTVAAAGGLIVLGIQSLFLFTGYTLGGGGSSQVGPGGPIGMFAAALLAASGIMALAGLAGEERLQGAGIAGPPVGPGTAAPVYQPPYPSS